LQESLAGLSKSNRWVKLADNLFILKDTCYKLTNSKSGTVSVNLAKENCGNPHKSYTDRQKALILQKKNAEIRNNLKHHDNK